MGLSLIFKEQPSYKFKLRQAILQAIIKVDTTCPNCGYVHSDEEIREGWNDDPYDFTTQCKNCKWRFVAQLNVDGDSDVLPIGRYIFLCPNQLYTAIGDLLNERGRSLLGQQFLLNNRPDLFWNMIRHHGNYKLGRAAFKRWQES